MPHSPPRLTRPLGPRSSSAGPGIGIVHLGLGAFFRAHGAIYVAQAMTASGGDWGIIGVSLQRPLMHDLLAPQGYCYTAVELGPDGPVDRVIDVIQAVLVGPRDPQAILNAMADPGVKIVSLTITEKGYCHDPATGRLTLSHPDIVHDIATPLPRSAPGYLVRALQLRRASGAEPFTVLCCDNLPRNGALVRQIVLDLAAAIDPGLADWIGTNGRFPSGMVDRIVPATTDADIAALSARSGSTDLSPVLHEPYRQWVIEDDFVGGKRPDFARVGVQMVSDVAPYERMKLRMLNGAHSALAYLGLLAGHQSMADTVADPVFARYVQQLWTTEIIPTLTVPQGMDLADYSATLLHRFANPAIRHLTAQIAMDGSQKLPQRILGTLRDNHAAGRDSPGLTLALAGWMRYLGGVTDAGLGVVVKDPLAAQLQNVSQSAGSSAELVRGFLAFSQIFDPAQAAQLHAPVTRAYDSLSVIGARRTVSAWL